jgi:hypothetical protein
MSKSKPLETEEQVPEKEDEFLPSRNHYDTHSALCLLLFLTILISVL